MAAITAPTDIADLALWLHAGSLGLADGTAVSTWSDSSGGGNNATQATSGKRPIYKTGIVNGLPVVRFDGTDDQLDTAAMQAVSASSGEWTAFAVASKTAYSGFRGILASDPGTGTNRLGNFLRYSTGAPQAQVFNTAGTAFTNSGTTQTVTGVFHVEEARLSGSSLLRQIDQSEGTAATFTGTKRTNTGVVNVGRGQANASEFHNGDIAEIVLYRRALSDTEAFEVRKYLGLKYGLPFAASVVVSTITLPAEAEVFVQSWQGATSPAPVAQQVNSPVSLSLGSPSTYPGTGKVSLGVWPAGTTVVIQVDGNLSTSAACKIRYYEYPPGPEPDNAGHSPPVGSTIDDPSWRLGWETTGVTDFNDHWTYVWTEPEVFGWTVGSVAIRN